MQNIYHMLDREYDNDFIEFDEPQYDTLMDTPVTKNGFFNVQKLANKLNVALTTKTHGDQLREIINQCFPYETDPNNVSLAFKFMANSNLEYALHVQNRIIRHTREHIFNQLLNSTKFQSCYYNTIQQHKSIDPTIILMKTYNLSQHDAENIVHSIYDDSSINLY